MRHSDLLPIVLAAYLAGVSTVLLVYAFVRP